MNIYLGILIAGFLLGVTPQVWAEGDETNWKDELKSDRQGVSEGMHEVNANAKAARAEEGALKDQIQEALKAGDKEKAKELRAQLKTMHKENVKEMRDGRQEVKESFKDMKGDIKKARKEGAISDRAAKDKLENIRDHREDIRDKKEDVRDAKRKGGKWDKREDVRDLREDVRDRKEDIRDHGNRGGKKRK
jgi:hypothetical protein